MNYSTGRVLVVDDEPGIGEAIRKALERMSYSVEVTLNAEAALEKVEREEFDLILCDIKLPDIDGIELVGRLRESQTLVGVVMITGYASIESAVASIKAGAIDYLPKPFTPEQLRKVVANALEHLRLREENAFLRGELKQLFGERVVVGQSPAMHRLFTLAQTVAAADSSVLVAGESGVGKEVLARFIHAESARKERPFVTVNCAAIPANLLESELFGHLRGAFTGAVYSRRGSFELAAGGTLFLDEIGEMPFEMQAKILRAIEQREVQRVGSEKPTTVNVRIIAATNKDLEREVEAGKFRSDLFWRLNVVQLRIPPLRERREDILPLARHFLEFYAHEMKKPMPVFSADALDLLNRHDWPGNVRELRNAIERAVIFSEPGMPIAPLHLSAGMSHPFPTSRLFRSLQEVEREHIREVLEACDGNRGRAAEILKISSVTLWRKLGKESAGDDEE